MDASIRLAKVIGICPFCHAETSVVAPVSGLDDYYKKGLLIQNSLPTLSPEEREMLLTGMCLQCQSKIFNSQES